jgi:hypothetical protein
MPRLKSFIKNINLEVAERTHNCHFNKKIRINKGDHRLNLKEGNRRTNYALINAIQMVRKDIEKLLELEKQIEAGLKSQGDNNS